MKTFLDLLDINTDKLLHVKVTLSQHGSVEYMFTINGVPTTELKVPLLDSIVLECRVVSVSDHSNITIERIEINGLEVMPKYLHLSEPASNFLNNTGVWQLVISEPFYRWYHRVTGQGWLLEPQ